MREGAYIRERKRARARERETKKWGTWGQGKRSPRGDRSSPWKSPPFGVKTRESLRRLGGNTAQ